MKIVFRIVGLCFVVTMFFACSNETSGEKAGLTKRTNKYGGVLRESMNENFQTLYPPAIADVVSSNIANQIYEGLVKFNPKTLAVEPCLAQKWETDSTATVYTFYLKKGVYFHNNLCFKNNKSREVTAADFKYCFEQLCTATPNNINFQSSFKDRVVGANKFYNETLSGKPKSSLEGVQVLDNYTLRIKLLSPDNSFLFILANAFASVYPKEGVALYNDGIKVGTGPFIFEEGKYTDKQVVLSRNPNYHLADSAGNTLPYLDSVVFFVIPDKDKELEAFKNGELDYIIGLPTETVSNVIQKDIEKFKGDSAEYVLDRMPEMVTQFYALNVTKPPFNNLKVRQAFNYAINKQKIINDILNGEAFGPGEHGICPPAFSGYDITKIKGYNFDLGKAKKLIAEAGYPGGKGFPKIKLELNSGGKKNTNVALEIQEQLMSTLGIAIDIEVVSLAKKMEDAMYAKAHIFRSGWVADYPDPESFLTIFNGKNVPENIEEPSYPNSMRYKNAAFDKLCKEAKMETSKSKAYEKYIQAEQLAMYDAPVIVLWYDENYRLSRSYLKNFHNNPMRYRNYATVYIGKKKQDQ